MTRNNLTRTFLIISTAAYISFYPIKFNSFVYAQEVNPPQEYNSQNMINDPDAMEDELPPRPTNFSPQPRRSSGNQTHNVSNVNNQSRVNQLQDPYQQAMESFNSGDYSRAITGFEQLLKQNPNDVNVRMNLVVAYINRGSYLFNKKVDLAKAANDYRKAIFYLKYDSNVPDGPDIRENLNIASTNLANAFAEMKINLTPKARLRLAKELRGQGNFKEAIVEFNQAANDPALRRESLETIGDVMVILLKDDKAIEYYGKALALNNNNGNLHLNMARALFRVGDLNSSLQEYNIALEQKNNDPEILDALQGIWESRVRENPGDATAHMNLGAVLQKKGDFQGAMAQYNASAMIDPSNATTRLNIATLFQAQKDFPSALKAYDSILQVVPNDKLVHYYKGTALKEMGLLREAMNEFQIVLGADPNNILAKKELFNCLRMTAKTPDEYLALLADFARNNPNDATAQYNLAFELHSRKKLDEAMVFYQKSLSIDPKLTDSYLNIASIYKDKGQYSDAVSMLKKGLNINPNNQKIKDMLAQTGDDASAVKYKEAVEKHNKGDYQGAVDNYLKILETSKPTTDIYTSLGAAYQAMNKNDEAIKAYTKAIELDKSNSTALYYLGISYYNNKNYKKALELYNKALAIDPENADIKQAISSAKSAGFDNAVQRGLDELNAKKYSVALLTFDNVIKADPNNGYAYYYRGMAYDALKKIILKDRVVITTFHYIP